MFGVGTSGPQSTSQKGQSRQADERAVRDALSRVVADAGALSPGVGVRLAQAAQREFAALEAEHLAALKKAGASDRDVQRRAAAGGTRSRKESSKQKKRADAVGENPDLAKKLGDGDIGDEHLDALADAAAKSGGDAARDTELIKELEDTKPDDAHKVTTKWLERREDDSAQSRYDRQRARRKAIKGRSVTSGCSTIELHGTDEQRAEMWARIEARANELYIADGGRDVPDSEHPRTYMQRLFDAAYELIMHQPAAGTVNTSDTNTSDIDTGSRDGEDEGDSGSEDRNDTSTKNDGNSETGGQPGAFRPATKTSAPSPRTMLHVTLTVDDEAEQQIRAACPNGSGYLPDTVLERYACGAMLGGTVFNQAGHILWHGRDRRHASPAQFAALVVRDGGCVLCGADVSRCQVHHLNPFNAAVQGETNIDELALVCTSCHHWLHDDKHTLYYLVAEQYGDKTRGSPPKLVWRTRPATPEEIAPNRPTKPAKPKLRGQSPERSKRRTPRHVQEQRSR